MKKHTHVEADNILVQQCYKSLAKLDYRVVKIISDDTDVFVLACCHYPEEREDLLVYMEPTKKGRTVVNIGETVKKHIKIIPSLLSGNLFLFVFRDENSLFTYSYSLL